MAKSKLTQVDFDLQEIECAMDFAKRGYDVNWSTAADAWCRLKDAAGSTLPKYYRPMFDGAVKK